MPLITIDMTGTVVAITGAGGNIGSAIAQRFAAASASVVLQTNLSEPPAIEAAGGTSSVRCDLSTPTGPDEVVAGAVEAFGK
ncbi:MAG: SDR family NAD(P)-dependent oxidoreductase, partial [Actinomycetota bacterium]|nr:SDR family NAD(P)-dependent oxidoreductase [Actinomycetota bacterium]